MSKQPEALQVADDCLCGADPGVYPQTYLGDRLMAARDQLIRQHALIEELREALRAITDDRGTWNLMPMRLRDMAGAALTKAEAQQ
jgi:hypothetical protein